MATTLTGLVTTGGDLLKKVNFTRFNMSVVVATIIACVICLVKLEVGTDHRPAEMHLDLAYFEVHDPQVVTKHYVCSACSYSICMA